MRTLKSSVSALALVGLVLTACGTTDEQASATDQNYQLSSASSSNTMLKAAALDAYQKGDWKRAADYYRKVAITEPNNYALNMTYADALRRSGNPEEAVSLLYPLIQSEKASDQLLMLHAKAALQANQPAQALASAERARSSMKYAAQAHYLAGTAYASLGDQDAALEAYKASLATGADKPAKVLNNMGLTLARMGKLNESLDVLGRASRLDADDPVIQQNLAMVRAIAASEIGAPEEYQPAFSTEPQKQPAIIDLPAPQAQKRVETKQVDLASAPQPKMKPAAFEAEPKEASVPERSQKIVQSQNPLLHLAAYKPDQMVATEEKAAEAARHVKPKLKVPSSVDVSKIKLRYGRHENYDRLVVDEVSGWKTDFEIVGNELTLTFPENFTGVRKKLVNALPETLTSVHVYQNDFSETKVAIKFQETATLKSWRLDERMIFDFHKSNEVVLTENLQKLSRTTKQNIVESSKDRISEKLDLVALKEEAAYAPHLTVMTAAAFEHRQVAPSKEVLAPIETALPKAEPEKKPTNDVGLLLPPPILVTPEEEQVHDRTEQPLAQDGLLYKANFSINTSEGVKKVPLMMIDDVQNLLKEIER